MEEEAAGLTVAKRLASCGWRVYPGFVSKDDEKVPYSGKGGSWVKNATTDFGKLEAWWADKPYLWPGVVGGPDSCITIDADGEDAVAWLRSAAAEYGWSTAGLIYRTPGRSGGLHAHYDYPEWLGLEFRLAKVVLETGGVVELRGAGCWTLTANPQRKRGTYEILNEPPLVGGCDAPRALLEKIIERSVPIGFGGGDGSLREISFEDAMALGAVYDGRKNLLAGLAWHESVRGGDYDSVLARCSEFNAGVCCPPLSESTVEAKVRYAVGRAEKIRAESLAVMSALQRNRNREF